MVEGEGTKTGAVPVVHANWHRAKQEQAFYGHLEGDEGEEGEAQRTIADYLSSRRVVMRCEPMPLGSERKTVKTWSPMDLAVDGDPAIEGMSFGYVVVYRKDSIRTCTTERRAVDWER